VKGRRFSKKKHFKRKETMHS